MSRNIITKRDLADFAVRTPPQAAEEELPQNPDLGARPRGDKNQFFTADDASAPDPGSFPVIVKEEPPREAAPEQQEPGLPEVDGYLSRLVKYIPSEVIAIYLTLEGIVKASEQRTNAPLFWCIFLFCLGGTWLWLRRIGKVERRSQILLSILAFAVWVFSIGGPFALYPSWYNPLYPALLLPACTFTIPLIEPR